VGAELDSVALLRLTASVAAVIALPALAHEGGAGSVVTAGLRWSFEPWVVAPLLLSAVLYAIGVQRLWRRAGSGRGITFSEAGRFAAGWVVICAALLSPIDTLGAELFSAHMLQHELLMVIAAPLLVLSRPLEAWTWALKPAWRKSVAGIARIDLVRAAWHACSKPMGAWCLHAVAIWVWHVPVLFEAALASEGVHIAQHSCFLGSALFFWWSVFGRDRPGAASLASLFTTMMHTSALGALLTLAPKPWYAHYAQASAFGLSALEDQQLGGLLMWVPGGVAYLAAALYIVAAWLGPATRQEKEVSP
jgi:putative membrane protein